MATIWSSMNLEDVLPLACKKKEEGLLNANVELMVETSIVPSSTNKSHGY
jgi:hypothetical protein